VSDRLIILAGLGRMFTADSLETELWKN